MLSVVNAAVTAGFAVYNGIFGIVYHSLWYGAFAGYLIVLSVLRFTVLSVYRIARLKYRNDAKKSAGAELKMSFAVGVAFGPLTVALSVMMLLLVAGQKPLVSNEIMAIATAAYTFCKIGLTIRNFAKGKVLNETMRNIGIVDSVFSVVMLESTLITAFGEADGELYVLLTLSGIAMALLAVGMGAFMTIAAIRKLHSIRNEGND